ncbi:TraB/GumN family protein [Paracoccus sp. (in: a-proteobacteria)]|uniref:TraB/GumN family protein n=1 Tax=Paracoccus sp. TaxID=267 RepID=UPI002729B2D8|nr:TraB/GumN family protein [Paracoccus sp. (in: a-proteobacteria)]
MAARIFLALALVAGTGLQAQAATPCEGQNLFLTMPAEDIAAIEAATEGVPFRRGLVFRATRDDLQMVLVGTYHFDDPRHAATLDLVRPEFEGATTLLVESGPAEQARLTEALTADPTLMVDPTGPTLPERLSPEEWAALSAALSDRGIPAIMASRMRPWYVSMMLGISPCMMRQMTEAGGVAHGLDHMLIDEAETRGLPVLSLEPWDTVFTLFEDLSPDQELDMIRANLPAAALADDYAVTLTDSYFEGDVWKLWEFARHDAHANSGLDPEVIDAQLELMQDRLMERRNRAWIEPLLDAAGDAAAQGGHVVAAFGALHLPGEEGVLNLLAAEGFEITRLDG